jgi:3-methyladenine DNA glycosylase AlkD
MATTAEIIRELEGAGSAQYRKIFANHGVKIPMFGVNTPTLKALQKKVKVNHEMALDLWATGNYDARYLATMIADPKKADNTLLDAWVHDLSDYGLTDAFVKFVARTPFCREKAEVWMDSDSEWISAAGWGLIGQLAGMDKTLSDEYFERCLRLIETTIHQRKNRTRYNMNGTLIAIGVRNDRLQAAALKVASAIGEVYVDHLATNCETPDAAAYIKKVEARKKATATKKK